MSSSRPCAVTTTASGTVGWLAGDSASGASAGGASCAKVGAGASSPATIARVSGEQRGRRLCRVLRAVGAFMVLLSSPRKKSQVGGCDAASFGLRDRKHDVYGTRVSVSVDLGARRNIKKK